MFLVRWVTGCLRTGISWWPLLKSGEIIRRKVIKCFAVWGWLFFEKTLFDEFRHSLRNLGRPVPNAGIEYPPLKDAVDRVLCLRLTSQIIENFRRR